MRNLVRAEAAERARLLDVASYEVTLDLTDAGTPQTRTFRSRSEISFACREPGADTFIEIAAERVHSATLNGEPVDTSGYDPGVGLRLRGLADENTLVVEADCFYSRSGQGLHRASDPVDGATYLYSQFETTDAQRAYACFDQPDLKAEFTFHVTGPTGWHVVSNMPVASERAGDGVTTTRFAKTPRMSTYITAICAGPYHVVQDSHDGIELGLWCRASMADHLDAADVFEITKQGFDFFHEQFDHRYPLPKYDQLFVPEYNAGAMENFGCVTISEDHYLFRSTVTAFEYEQRSNTVLHELAHMWFGDLVTMRWWDDLWLNESFAEWASHWCNAEATRFSNAWSTFLAQRKAWGYRQDQLSSTHPVYCEIPDVDAVEVNFDGITYAKGASVIKQLVAYVGIESFVTGLRAYFQANAYGNATFEDLLTALEQASGRELRKFAAEWLETAQVNTLRPVVSIDGSGRYTSVAIAQSAPADYPTLRTHRLAVGLYDIVDEGAESAAADGREVAADAGRVGALAAGALTRRERLELDVTGERTDVPQLAGVRAPAVLLLNDDDLTYAKIRLDERSAATVVRHISGLASPLARSLCWSAAWDMVRDAELPARDYVRQVVAGLPAERDVNLVAVTARQAMTSLAMYADPAWAPQGWRDLARAAAGALAAADPGSDLQLAWARGYASTARDTADLATLRGWLSSGPTPAGLKVDTGLRWHVLESLVALGAAGSADIDAELERDRTATGQVLATRVRALAPTREAKAEAWRRLTEDSELSNAHGRALAQGFQHPSQVDLTQPYAERYFDQVADVWERSDGDPAQVFAVLMYPAYQVAESTVAATDAWLADSRHPTSLRRLVAEGKDGVLRALAARARDAS
ncbi:MAG: aminopeptidase N [Micromonosporaceae bacterium]|nr:aminopeptidase N [Micromonosporaceae bacterium]